MFKFTVFLPGLWGFPAMGQGVLEPQEKAVVPYRRAPSLKDAVGSPILTPRAISILIEWNIMVLMLQAETQETRERVCLGGGPHP